MPRNQPLHRVIERNIRREAASRNLTIQALADFAGVSRSQLYNVFEGTYSPTLDWLGRVADALEVDVVDLLREE